MRNERRDEPFTLLMLEQMEETLVKKPQPFTEYQNLIKYQRRCVEISSNVYLVRHWVARISFHSRLKFLAPDCYYCISLYETFFKKWLIYFAIQRCEFLSCSNPA